VVDTVDKATRSRMMAGIGRADTAPEMAIRRYLHACGLRFRLHARGLPGRPDIVFPGARIALFVHGCFWHRHPGCRFATTPSTNASFWVSKFAANVARDAEKSNRLQELGWTPLVIWECETRDPEAIDRLYWHLRAASLPVR
jgi:DNA mismatch endonuclease (patch repair protein)